MGEFVEGVRLLHELRELRPSEELPHRSHDGTDVDQSGWRGLRRVHLCRHALLDDPFHAQQAHADLLLYQLSHRADAPVAQMVYVVPFLHTVVDLDHCAQKADDVILGQDADVGIGIQAQAPVDLISPNPPQVVPPRVEEEVVEQLPRVVDAGRLARPQPSVELQHRLLTGIDANVLVDGRLDELVLRVVVHIPEQLENLLVGHIAQRPQQHGGRTLPLPVYLDGDDVLVARLELHPRAVEGDHLRRGKLPAGIGVRSRREVGAGRPDELANDYPLGPVDDERTRPGHDRYVADEQVLELAFALGRAWRPVDELHPDFEGRGVGRLVLPAVLLGGRRLVERVVQEVQLEAAARVVLHRGDLLEQLPQAFGLEPTEGVYLRLDEVRHLQHGRRPRVDTPYVLAAVH